MKPAAVATLIVAAAVAIAGSALGVRHAQAKASERPNVILILADDLGYGDVGAYGGKIPTPNIDALARSGVRYTDGYVTAAVCAPSRSGLLSGRHQSRFGFEFNPVGRDETSGLPQGETIIPQVMKRAGYATGMVGKWHIGQSKGYHPLDRGFDSYYGVLGGAALYVANPADAVLSVIMPVDGQVSRARLPIYEGRQVVEPQDYLTDVFADKAAEFIRGHKDGPFFLYVPFTAPHTPLQATRKYADRFPDIKDPHARTYAAMVSAMDDGVGRIVAEVRAQGLEKKTVIVFLSDNGCPNYIRGACTNANLAGYKGFPWEGGIRIPFIVSAPGRLKPGGVDARPVSSLDLMPTFAGLAGVKAPASAEGASLFAKTKGERAFFWRTGPNHAVRDGRWKLLVVNKSERVENIDDVLGSPIPDGVKAEISPLGQWVLLFDLMADPGEQRDLAAQHPEVVARLAKRFDAWDQSNVAPMFTSRRQFRGEVGGRRVQLFN